MEQAIEQAGGYASVVTDDMTVTSSSQSAEQMEAQFSPAPDADAPVEAPKQAESADRDDKGKFVAKAAKPRNDPQARIDQSIAKQREAERRADAAEQKVAEYERRQAAPVPRPQPVAAPVETKEATWKRFAAMPDAPKIDQFTNYEDYTDARAAFIADKRFEEREAAKVQQDARSRQEQETRSVDETWLARLHKARTESPDAVAAIDPRTPLSQPMMHVIKKSEVGVELLKHLSDNQELAQRLSTLHPAEALWEMGKLEARLDAAPSGSVSQAPVISKAKAPIKPLGTSPVAPSDGPPDDDAPVEQHIAYWNTAERKKRRG